MFKSLRYVLATITVLYVALAIWCGYRWTLLSFPESRFWWAGCGICVAAAVVFLATIKLIFHSSANVVWELVGKLSAVIGMLTLAGFAIIISLFLWEKASVKANYDKPVFTKEVVKSVRADEHETGDYRLGLLVRRDTKLASLGHVSIAFVRSQGDKQTWERVIGLYSDIDKDPATVGALKLALRASKAELRDEATMGNFVFDGRVPMYFFRVNKLIYDRALARADAAQARCKDGERYVLGVNDCVAFVDSVVSAMDGQPHFVPVLRHKFELPIEYVNDVIRANGEPMRLQ